jgi:hypothetical protein
LHPTGEAWPLPLDRGVPSWRLSKVAREATLGKQAGAALDRRRKAAKPTSALRLWSLPFRSVLAASAERTRSFRASLSQPANRASPIPNRTPLSRFSLRTSLRFPDRAPGCTEIYFASVLSLLVLDRTLIPRRRECLLTTRTSDLQ